MEVAQRPDHVVLVAKLDNAGAHAVNIGKDNVAGLAHKVLEVLPAGGGGQALGHDAKV